MLIIFHMINFPYDKDTIYFNGHLYKDFLNSSVYNKFKKGENGMYLVYAKAAGGKTLTTDDVVVKLSGTVESLGAAADGFITLA